MAYADTTELARVLKIGNPSDAQEAALDRVLEAAATEIDLFLDLAAGESVSSAGGVAILEQVNLARAAELWKFEEVTFGAILGNEFAGSVNLPRDSFAKYIAYLAPLKGQFGFA